MHKRACRCEIQGLAVRVADTTELRHPPDGSPRTAGRKPAILGCRRLWPYCFNVRFGALHHDSARRRMEVFAKFGCQISANATSPFQRDSCQKAGRALQPQSCKHDNPTRLIFSNVEARRISNDDTHRHDPNGTNFTPYPRMPPRPCSSVRSHRAWPCSCHCSRAPPSLPPTKPRRKVSIWS